MNDLFEQTVFWTSLIAGIVSILSIAVSQFIYRKSKQELSEKIEESKLNHALKSNDIKNLGKYLDESLSKVTISQYSSSSSVSFRVNRYLDLLKEFVGTTEEVRKDSIEFDIYRNKPEIKWIENKFEEPQKTDNTEINAILNELQTGEVWNALARLRRFIEIELRDIAISKKIMIRTKNVSSGRLLEQLYRLNVIDLSIYTDFKLSISICNQAIHGFDVEFNEAMDAFNHAIGAWRRLKKIDE